MCFPKHAIEFGGGRCSSLHLRLGRTRGSAGAIRKRIRDCARILRLEGGILGNTPRIHGRPWPAQSSGVGRSRARHGVPLVPRSWPLVAPWHEHVTRHSGAREAWVRLRYLPRTLELEVEDHGSGFVAQSVQQGIGLVAMRERAELLGGVIEFARPVPSGER